MTIALVLLAAPAISLLAFWLRAERGRLLLPSTRAFLREGGRLHGYVYARWTRQYADLLLNCLPPTPGALRLLVGEHHGKVLTHDDPKAIITPNRTVGRQDLDRIVPHPAARDLLLCSPPDVKVYECVCRSASAVSFRVPGARQPRRWDRCRSDRQRRSHHRGTGSRGAAARPGGVVLVTGFRPPRPRAPVPLWRSVMHRFFSTRMIVCLAATLLGLILAGTEALALVPHRDLGALGREAERIVQGRVMEVRAAFDADHSLIHTYVTLDVDRTLKGRGRPRRLTLRVIGGEVGGLGVFVPDAPVFREGEEVIVLLGRDDEGYLTVHGWKQGKHEIRSGFVQETGVSAERLAEALTGAGPDLPERPEAAEVCPVLCVTSTPLTRWPGPQLDEPYLVNRAPMADCSESGWIGAVAAAAETWNATPSSFTFVAGGTTTLTSKGAQPDGHNVIHVGSAGGALAYTIVWYDPRSGTIIENDMVVSKTKRFFRWSCDPQAVIPGRYDVQSAVTHELGHFLYLDDVREWACRDLTMYGALYPATLEPRSLEPPDVCGIERLYP